MSLLGVPWFIDGGNARHDAKIARMLSYAATNGMEGVSGALDLRVRELETPGAAVRAAPGGVVVLNRALGGAYETYLDKADSEFTIDIAPTDSSGGRSDLVILRVENPWEAGGGWDPPVDEENGPYIHARVIQGVDPGLTDVHDYNANWSAITLCRIDIPASTATITDSMIVDLRSISGLGGERINGVVAHEMYTEASRSQTGNDDLVSTETTFVNWPSVANWQVPVPSWANGVDIFCVVANPEQHSGHVWGELRLNIGNGQSVGIPSTFDMDAISTTQPNRIPVFCSGTQPIPANVRGQIVNVKLEARQYADAATTGFLRAQAQTYTYVQLRFKRNPSYV